MPPPGWRVVGIAAHHLDAARGEGLGLFRVGLASQGVDRQAALGVLQDGLDEAAALLAGRTDDGDDLVLGHGCSLGGKWSAGVTGAVACRPGRRGRWARRRLRTTQQEAPMAWKRLGQYMLQAFRHTGTEPLTPPPWTRA
jgi:hypothetical protein